MIPNAKLNELYAVHVDNEKVVGHLIPEVDQRGSDSFLTARTIPDYVRHLGRDQVTARLKQKGVQLT